MKIKPSTARRRARSKKSTRENLSLHRTASSLASWSTLASSSVFTSMVIFLLMMEVQCSALLATFPRSTRGRIRLCSTRESTRIQRRKRWRQGTCEQLSAIRSLGSVSSQMIFCVLGYFSSVESPALLGWNSRARDGFNSNFPMGILPLEAHFPNVHPAPLTYPGPYFVHAHWIFSVWILFHDIIIFKLQ